jgi:hypothetical protein
MCQSLSAQFEEHFATLPVTIIIQPVVFFHFADCSLRTPSFHHTDCQSKQYDKCTCRVMLVAVTGVVYVEDCGFDGSL